MILWCAPISYPQWCDHNKFLTSRGPWSLFLKKQNFPNSFQAKSIQHSNIPHTSNWKWTENLGIEGCWFRWNRGGQCFLLNYKNKINPRQHMDHPIWGWNKIPIPSICFRLGWWDKYVKNLAFGISSSFCCYKMLITKVLLQLNCFPSFLSIKHVEM